MDPAQLNAYLQSEANTVKIPYLVISRLVLLVGLLFLFSKLPSVKEPAGDEHGTKFSLTVFRHLHVKWAVIAQFFYVGAQVGVGSFFIRFTKYVMDMPEKQAAFRLGSIAMVGFMVGRFTGTFLMRYIKPARLLSLYAVDQCDSAYCSADGERRTGRRCALCVLHFLCRLCFPRSSHWALKNSERKPSLLLPFS